MAGVFTLLTIALGEEIESRFFKILSCVSSVLFVLWSHRFTFKTVLTYEGSGCDLCHHVARNCGGNSPSLSYWADILCPMSRYGFVPERKGNSEEKFGKPYGGGENSCRETYVRCVNHQTA